MELQIEDLISSIKKDGVDKANAEAAKILADAKKKADDLLDETRKEQERIKQQTASEIEILRESARVGAEQAMRDAVLLFEKAVQNRFERILEADVQNCVRPENLSVLIRAAIGNENPADYAAEVAAVTEGLKAELAKEIENGLEIKVSPSVKRGFRLQAKDGSGYFDLTDEELTSMLKPFLPEIKF